MANEILTNYDAEESVLGAILIDPDAIITIATILEPEDFGRAEHKAIYAAMLDLYRQSCAIDAVTVDDALEGKNIKPVARFLTVVPTSIHAEHYANIVKKFAVRRSLHDAAQKIALLAHNDTEEDVHGLLAGAEKIVTEVSQKTPTLVTTIKSEMQKVFDGIFEPKEVKGDRVFTGFPGLDSAMVGIENSRFWVGAAVPGSGKSSFAVNLVRGVARQNRNVVILYFHPEQSAAEINSLLLSCGTPNDPMEPNHYVPPLRIKALQMTEGQRQSYLNAGAFLQNSTVGRYANGKAAEMAKKKEDYLRLPLQEWEIATLSASRAEVESTTIILNDPSGETIHKIRATVRRVRARMHPDTFLFVVFDGMHLIPGAGEGNRLAELMTITRTFKIMAQKDVTPGAVLVNHQLVKSFFSEKQNRQYHNGLLRDSGTVANDADVIYFLDRPSMWTNGQAGTWDNLDLICTKNRQTSNEFRAFFKMHTSTMRIEGRDVV
ncbi:MAG: DnaB-like helicase C-terminal domain-containing protein [Dehalococcoidales bacterium]|nr:DnaB-like helicase C-terminal domain-containing protein [Dehalococcoidales bacterium]